MKLLFSFVRSSGLSLKSKSVHFQQRHRKPKTEEAQIHFATFLFVHLISSLTSSRICGTPVVIRFNLQVLADFDKLWVLDDFKSWFDLQHFFFLFACLFLFYSDDACTLTSVLQPYALIVPMYFFYLLLLFAFLISFFVRSISINTSIFRHWRLWHCDILSKFMCSFNYLLIYMLCFIKAYQFVAFILAYFRYKVSRKFVYSLLARTWKCLLWSST